MKYLQRQTAELQNVFDGKTETFKEESGSPRCVGEPFPMFSDEENEDEELGEGRLCSRMTPLSDVDYKLSDQSGQMDGPRVKEIWLAEKQEEVATAKRKLEKLDVAYVKKRIELTRILDDFQHLAEVKTQLTARVGELTEQIQQAKRLHGIIEELFRGNSQGGKQRLVPKPPSPQPESLWAAVAAGAAAAARNSGPSASAAGSQEDRKDPETSGCGGAAGPV